MNNNSSQVNGNSFQTIPQAKSAPFNPHKETKQNDNDNDNSYTYLTHQIIEKQKKAIEFERSLIIDQENFNSALNLSNEIIQEFKTEYVFEICKLSKLTPLQRNMLEIIIYLLGYQYFDWNHMKEQLIYELRSKLSKIKYDHISMSKLNYLLNKFCINDEFPKYITPFSMNYLYQWVKCQIKIILFKIQNKTKSELIAQDISTLKTPRYLTTKKSLSNCNEDCLTKRNTMRKSMSQIPMINRVKGTNTRSVIQKKILQLNEFNYVVEKENKEKASIEALPLLYNKSYNQMRKIYSFPLKHIIEELDSKHSNQLNSVSIRGINNKNKFINWISTKKTVALNGVPQYKVIKLLKIDNE